jgi:hypothetical protein
MDTENKSFEGQVRQAFAGAELVPGERVWSGLELFLDEPALAARKISFYKWLAAACLFLAAFSAGLNVYLLRQEGAVADQEAASAGVHAEAGQAASELPVIADMEPDPVVVQSEPDEREMRPVPNDKDRLVASADDNRPRRTLNLGLTEAEIEKSEVRRQKLEFNPSLPDPLETSIEDQVPSIQDPTSGTQNPSPEQLTTTNDQLIAQPKEEKKRSKDRRSSDNSRLFASLGFGAGSFNPQPSLSPVAASPAVGGLNSGSSSSLSNGSSYSAGFSIGTKVSDRFALTGGVSYLNQSTSFTSNVAQESAVSGVYRTSSFADATVDKTASLVQTNPYDVSSTLEYISVPLQAGYLIVDRKFGWQMNGGLSADFFLRNTLNSDASGFLKSSQGSGSESPYTGVGFSGLLNTELSYRFGERYRLSLNPGMRYSLNSLYKSSIGIESQPLTLDVGLRLRYLFK